jgi:hypothetical protein
MPRTLAFMWHGAPELSIGTAFATDALVAARVAVLGMAFARPWLFVFAHAIRFPIRHIMHSCRSCKKHELFIRGVVIIVLHCCEQCDDQKQEHTTTTGRHHLYEFALALAFSTKLDWFRISILLIMTSLL